MKTKKQQNFHEISHPAVNTTHECEALQVTKTTETELSTENYLYRQLSPTRHAPFLASSTSRCTSHVASPPTPQYLLPRYRHFPVAFRSLVCRWFPSPLSFSPRALSRSHSRFLSSLRSTTHCSIDLTTRYNNLRRTPTPPLNVATALSPSSCLLFRAFRLEAARTLYFLPSSKFPPKFLLYVIGLHTPFLLPSPFYTPKPFFYSSCPVIIILSWSLRIYVILLRCNYPFILFASAFILTAIFEDPFYRDVDLNKKKQSLLGYVHSYFLLFLTIVLE